MLYEIAKGRQLEAKLGERAWLQHLELERLQAEGNTNAEPVASLEHRGLHPVAARVLRMRR